MTASAILGPRGKPVRMCTNCRKRIAGWPADPEHVYCHSCAVFRMWSSAAADTAGRGEPLPDFAGIERDFIQRHGGPE